MFLIYLVFPIIEIYFLFTASKYMGFFPVLGLVVLTAWIGSRLVRSQGLIVLSQFQTRMNEGHLPKKEAIEGLLILAAGILLIAPGFITDAIGILCLLPFTRPVIAIFFARWIEGKIKKGQFKVYTATTFGGPGQHSGGPTGFGQNPFIKPEVRDVTPIDSDQSPKELI
jgi:UPF0716 protein FxsA